MGQTNSGLETKIDLEIPHCRFCDEGPEKQTIKGRTVYEGSPNQKFFKCGACGMIYLFPVLSEKEEEAFYAKEFEKFMAKRSGQDKDWTGPEKHFTSSQPEAKRRLAFLEKHVKSGESCLEIGCSSGFMLSALKEKGLNVCGLEPSGVFTDFVMAKGIKIFSGLEALKEEALKFDTIIHYFVLEHIRNPLEFISEYMAFLNDGGKMIFDVPCASDPLIELYSVPAFDRFYWSVVHHWYFTQETLAKVLERTGYRFKLYPDQRYDLSNHVTWMTDGKPGGMKRYSHVFGDELDTLYKQVLKERWICDTISALVWKK